MNPESWRNEYPFESHFFEIDGHRLHYIDTAPNSPDGKPKHTILAVHGNPTWSFYWRNVASHFSSCRVIAVDHIGCGLSDKPQHYDYCLDNHARNLEQLIRHLDLSDVTLLAHDWGGAIGTLTLTRNLDRFARITLLNTGTFPPPFIPTRIAACRIPIFGALGVRGLNLFARAAITMAMSSRTLSPATKAGLLAPYDSWANRVAIHQFVQDIPRDKHHRTWSVLTELEESLSKIQLPTKLIWGMKDWCFTPECMEKIQQIIPHAESVPINDAGHYVMEDATEQVLDEISRFLGTDPE